jgi:hypothetical protein
MAKYKKTEAKELARVFADAYNKANRTNFIWIDHESYEPEEPYDFMLFDNDAELGLQAVRAVADPVREFIKPKKADAVVRLLLERFNTVKPRQGLVVYLDFHTLPKNNEAEKLAYRLEFLIREKVKRERASYYAYDAKFDDHYLPYIKNYVSKIRILPNNKGDTNVHFITSTSEEFPIPWLDDVQRVTAAVQNKQKKYSNVILLVDSATFPIDDYYIPLIKEALAEMNFPEIWIVDNFSSKRRAFRVK